MIFRKFPIWTKGTVEEYIKEEISSIIQDLNTGLSRLKLWENFEAELYRSKTIPANSTVQFQHRFGVVPTGRVILKQDVAGDILDGAYSNNSIELVNNTGNDIVISFVILK